jgi:predicted SprT family Zn-dependent metalloprotease
MKDLILISNICKKHLEDLGIKYGNVRNWSVNTRAKSRLGQCKKVGIDTFDINISERLLEDNLDIQIALNTIMHEMLHTIPGCFNHGKKWKTYASYINQKLPQYNITRVAVNDSVGVHTEHEKPVFNYVLRCSGCGQEIKRQRKSKVITNYKKYRCGKCGGRFERML